MTSLSGVIIFSAILFEFESVDRLKNILYIYMHTFPVSVLVRLISGFTGY